MAPNSTITQSKFPTSSLSPPILPTPPPPAMNKLTTILSLSANQFQSPIHAAAHEGNLPALKQALLESPTLLEQPNEQHETPLYICASQGHLDCLSWLLREKHANVNCATIQEGRERGATPLWIASKRGHLDIVQELLRNRAEVGKAVVGGITPLYVAAQEGHVSVVHELLNYGANVNRASYNGSTPLFVASYRGHAPVVEKLIEYHANINKASSGVTPLYVAAQEGHLEIVRLLLRFGADLDKDNNEGNTPLFAAAEAGHLSIVQVLLSSGANVDAANDQGATPLWIASVNGNPKVVHELLLADAEVDYDTDTGVSPLYTAAANGHLEVLKELLAHDAQVDKMYGDITPLYVACENGFEQVVKELLDYEADVDLCTDNGASPLYIAASCGYTQIVELLIDAHSSVDVSGTDGLTPLMAASQNGHTDVVRVLLTHKADVDAQHPHNGLSSIYAAAQNGHAEIVSLLIEWKCEIDVAHCGKTALYIACQNGHESVVRILVENGADLNWKRSVGVSEESLIHSSSRMHAGGDDATQMNQSVASVGMQQTHAPPPPTNPPSARSHHTHDYHSLNGGTPLPDASPIPHQRDRANSSAMHHTLHDTSTHQYSAHNMSQSTLFPDPGISPLADSVMTPQTAPQTLTSQVKVPPLQTSQMEFSNIQPNASSQSTRLPPQQQPTRRRNRAQSYTVAPSANFPSTSQAPHTSRSTGRAPIRPIAGISSKQQARLMKAIGKKPAPQSNESAPNEQNNNMSKTTNTTAEEPSPSPPLSARSQHLSTPGADLSPVDFEDPFHQQTPVASARSHVTGGAAPHSARTHTSTQPPIAHGITPIAAACIWNHPSIVKYLLSQNADITILTQDGLSLSDLNVNPDIDQLLTQHQTKKQLRLTVRDKFIEKVALKADVLEKDGTFHTDIEVLWELLRQIQSQTHIVQQVSKTSTMKLIYEKARQKLGDHNVPFDEFELLMNHYNKYQDRNVQQKYIFDQVHLADFYRRSFTKFTQLMLGTLITHQKTLQNEAHSVTVNPGLNPMAPKNLSVPSITLDKEKISITQDTLLLKGLTAIVQFCTDRPFDSLAQKEILSGEYSLVAASVAKVTKLTEQIARQLALRYEHQISQLKPQSVLMAAEIAISRLVHFLSHNEFNDEDAIDKQILSIIFKFQAIYPKQLETRFHVLGLWTADGMFRCSGIRTKLHALYRLPADAPCCNQPEDYGFRLGSQKEVQALTMEPTDMSVIRQQYENPIFQLIARRENVPRFSSDKRSNQLELKIARMEQAYQVQQKRFEQAERLLLQQNETIRQLKRHIIDDDVGSLAGELDSNDAEGSEKKKSQRLEKRVKTLIHTMKQFENTLDSKEDGEGRKLTRKDSRTCVVM